MVGNSHNCCAEVRNNMAPMRDQIACFNDFRFVGRSGRGRQFHLTITICTENRRVATVKGVIKVTKDGKRNKRKAKFEAISLLQDDASPSYLAKRRSLVLERSVIDYANKNNDQRVDASAIQSFVVGECNIRGMNECTYSGFTTLPASIYSDRWPIAYWMQTYVEGDIMNNYVTASSFHNSAHYLDLLLYTVHPYQTRIIGELSQINTLPFFSSFDVV